MQQSPAYDGIECAPSGGRTQVGAAGPVGIRQSGYFGLKTRFQVYLAATVANLTLDVGQHRAFGQRQ